MTYTDLFTVLVRAEIELWNALEARLVGEAHITLPTFQALSAVRKLADPVRVQDISEELSITVGATSKLVDRLERDGLVRRESNPTDRRSSTVLLTAKGGQTLDRAETVAEAHLEATLSSDFPQPRAVSLAAELQALRSSTGEGVTS